MNISISLVLFISTSYLLGVVARQHHEMFTNLFKKRTCDDFCNMNMCFCPGYF